MKRNTSTQNKIEKDIKNEDSNTSFFSQEEQEEHSFKNVLSNECSQSVGIEKNNTLLWNVHHGCSTLCDQTR
jgi:hypothetical protein